MDNERRGYLESVCAVIQADGGESLGDDVGGAGNTSFLFGE